MQKVAEPQISATFVNGAPIQLAKPQEGGTGNCVTAGRVAKMKWRANPMHLGRGGTRHKE